MVSAVTNPRTWELKMNIYIFISEESTYQSIPKLYREPVAKSRFTRDFKYYDEHLRDSTGAIKYEHIEYVKRHASIFKNVNGEWHLVFETHSRAMDAFIEGHISVRELRDSIDW